MAWVFPAALAFVAAATLLLAPPPTEAGSAPPDPAAVELVAPPATSDVRTAVPADAERQAAAEQETAFESLEEPPDQAQAGDAPTAPGLDAPPEQPQAELAEAEAADDLTAVAAPAPIPVFFMPVEGVRVADVPASFGDPRGERLHAGVDIMAPRGTPVRAAAPGTVWRIGESGRGGLSVTVIGDDGVRYFYTHLDAFAEGLERRQRVGVDTVIGYVGNTGNAAATAPHLHFEVSLPVEGEDYAWTPIDPLPHMLDRE